VVGIEAHWRRADQCELVTRMTSAIRSKQQLLSFLMDADISFTPNEVANYYAARAPKLKPARGGERRGPCPIHGGKDDNFAVDPETGLWFCHSVCGRGGDILALEQALTGVDFKAAKAEVFHIIGRFDMTSDPHGRHPAHPRISAT